MLSIFLVCPIVYVCPLIVSVYTVWSEVIVIRIFITLYVCPIAYYKDFVKRYVNFSREFHSRSLYVNYG